LKKNEQSSTSIDQKQDGMNDEMPLDEFYSDEEPENFES